MPLCCYSSVSVTSFCKGFYKEVKCKIGDEHIEKIY